MIDELERLKRDLDEARDDLIRTAPYPYGRLLFAYGHPMESWDDLWRWQSATVDEIIGSAQYDDTRRAACPLCHATTENWGTKIDIGWTREGLSRHLTGSGHITECRIMKTAFHMHRDRNREKFQAADRRKHEETERRKKIEPMIRLTPHGEPEFFNQDKSYIQIRSPESIALAQEQLRESGIPTELTGNVTAYRLVRDKWMVLADPREENVLRLSVYKLSGKTHWKYAGRFDVRGMKGWPVKIEAGLQKIIASVP